MGDPWATNGLPMEQHIGNPWVTYEQLMGSSWDIITNPWAQPHDSHMDIPSMLVSWAAYGMSHRAPMDSPSMIDPWATDGEPMGNTRATHGLPISSALATHEEPIGNPWTVHTISPPTTTYGLPWATHTPRMDIPCLFNRLLMGYFMRYPWATLPRTADEQPMGHSPRGTPCQDSGGTDYLSRSCSQHVMRSLLTTASHDTKIT